ncbi:MAG: YbdK family carboxylate-amine ligase [Deltaproteobacteria bacterium]|nr:YbdK family carboxylate-amine ligase [Deltaproteobacteria bacterium]
MAILFKPSEKPTIGIELELQILDRDTFALKNSSDELIARLASLGSNVKHEILNSTIEINTGIHEKPSTAYGELVKSVGLVVKEAKAMGLSICMAGTHPFSPWKEQKVTNDARYLRLVEKLGLIARRSNTFGLHVHVGIGSGERCIHVLNRIMGYMPHLLSLSANSPFWQGDDTGLDSYRIKVFESLPIAGLPFYFHNWSDYEKIVDAYVRTNTIQTIRELWWDVRPHPDFGTIEARILDATSTIEEAVSLAALIQALVVCLDKDYGEEGEFKRPHSFVVRENKWRAARYGLGARFITDDASGEVSVIVAIEKLLDMVEDDAKRLGSVRELDGIRRVLKDGNGSARQRRLFKETGELRSVSRALTKLLEDEVSAEGRV